MSVTARYRVLDGQRLREHTATFTASVLEQLLQQSVAGYGVLIQDQPEPGASLRAEVIFGTRVGTDLGAIFYTDSTGAWFSCGTAMQDGDEELYLAEMDFPPNAEIPLTQLRQALLEYEQTRQRPACLDWQPAT